MEREYRIKLPLYGKPHIKLRRFVNRPNRWIVLKPTSWNRESGALVLAAREFVKPLNAERGYSQ